MKSIFLTAAVALALLPALSAKAEILASSPEHFHFVIKAQSSDSPEVLWARLIEPSEWWSDSHTYSGSAANLTLDPQAGGLWREDWSGGSVAHGRVLYARPPAVLRLEAPFGPLQEKSIDAVWTISVELAEGGSQVTFEFVANGSSYSQLDALAPAVQMVKSQALQALVKPTAHAVAGE